MRQAIQNELAAVEAGLGVRVLYACESGSRAWGFASPDSDWDVRFIYAHPRDWYLGLEERRDTAEWRLDDVFDVSGWDASKFLRLMRASNPTVFEWLSSPIVYAEVDVFVQVRELAERSFQPVSIAHHYAGMTEKHIAAYLGGEKVKPKKYLYPIRALLAARWVEREKTIPPIVFEELRASMMEPDMASVVDDLLAAKLSSVEDETIPHIPAIDRWITSTLAEVKDAMPTEMRPKPAWEECNAVFLKMVGA